MTEAQKQIIQRLDQILAATGGGGGGGVTDVTGTAPVASSGGATPAISIAPATSSDPGSMSAADKTKLDGLPGYLIYTALLTQTGTDAPVATVLQNTLGGTVVWIYAAPGIYSADLPGVFTLNKTFVHIKNGSLITATTPYNHFFRATQASLNNITVESWSYREAVSFAAEDGLMTAVEFEIRVFP